MEITFTINEFSLETSPFVDRAALLDMLSRSAWHELQKTSDSEIVVRADMGEHKLQIHLEKHPGTVDDGFITMKDYLHDRLSKLILSMYRTKDKEEALNMINCLSVSGFPVSPNNARKLYNDAGLELPEHLKEVEISEEEKKFRAEMGMKLFE